MPTKEPVQPPKFNIRDEVIFKQLRYKIINRRYKNQWYYSIELNVPFPPDQILACPPEVKESFLELAPPSELDPMHFSVPETPTVPESKYKQGDKVMYGIEWYFIKRMLVKQPEQTQYYYNLVQCNDVNFNDQIISRVYNVPEDIIKPYPPQETTTVVNEHGGRQSYLDARFDCIPPVVFRLLAQCLGFGARKYGKDNWKNIPQCDHLNHAMNHINEWNRGNRDEPHLVNAMARLTFALWQAVDSKDQPDTYLHPDDTK